MNSGVKGSDDDGDIKKTVDVFLVYLLTLIFKKMIYGIIIFRHNATCNK